MDDIHAGFLWIALGTYLGALTIDSVGHPLADASSSDAVAHDQGPAASLLDGLLATAKIMRINLEAAVGN